MRLAEQSDIPELIEMSREFHKSVAPPWGLSEGGLQSVLSSLVARPSGYVARTEKGFIAGLIEPNPIAENWLVASEFLWWAEDNQGGALQRAFRKWAKDSGAHEIRWSCPAGNDRVRKHYARHSQETEVIYSEVLPCA